MFSKKNQKKLNPEQVRREEDQKREESRRGKILKEKIYPLLLEDDKEIENIKVFLQVFDVAMSRAFMQQQANTKVQDLKLEDELKNNPEAERYHKTFSILNEETITVASDLLKSMGQIIDNCLHDENKLRKMSELKLKYFDK